MKTENRYFVGDYLLAGECIVIGLTEAAHLAAVFMGRSFSDCTIMLTALLAAFLIAAVGHGIVARYRVSPVQKKIMPFWTGYGKTEWIFLAVFGCVVLSQIYFILSSESVYRQGDMTVEAVNSFLETDAVYQVNPVTGQPYTAGMPLRLKILCLPTLYGSICRVTGLSPRFVVWKLIPVLTLLFCYLAYAMLARSLFPCNRKKRSCFMTVVALLLWAGNYMFGMEGFGVLSCGFRGVSVRNAVLLPWLFSLLIRKKRFPVFLCIFAEACIVWTFYGLGACAAATVGMAAAGLWMKRHSAGKEAA